MPYPTCVWRGAPPRRASHSVGDPAGPRTKVAPASSQRAAAHTEAPARARRQDPSRSAYVVAEAVAHEVLYEPRSSRGETLVEIDLRLPTQHPARRAGPPA